MLKLIYIVLFLASSLLAINQHSDPRYLGTIYPKHFKTTLDFKWVGNLPIVDVTIKGKVYKFLFDTGAPTMLPIKLVKELKLKPLTTKILHDSTGKNIPVNLYTLPSLQVNGIEFRDFTIVDSNFTTTFPTSCLKLDGVLGYNYLQYMVVKLDMNNQRITISDTLMNHKGYIPIDIKFESRYGPVVNLYFPFGHAGFQIDTGNNTDIQIGTISIIPAIEKLKYLSRETNGVFVSGIGGIKHHNRKIEYMVKDFSIDKKIDIKAFTFNVNQSGAFLIGENFLKKFIIIIDFLAKKSYFKLNKKAKFEEKLKDTFGFSTMWSNKSGVYIGSLSSNTPAAKAGLQLGDKILLLNGRNMDNFTEDKFCKFIINAQSDPNSFDKQKSLTLVIKRQNKKIKKIKLVK